MIASIIKGLYIAWWSWWMSRAMRRVLSKPGGVAMFHEVMRRNGWRKSVLPDGAVEYRSGESVFRIVARE